METLVIAEFDSEDLADLASGRVKGMMGVTGIEVLHGDRSENSHRALNLSIMSAYYSSPFTGVTTFGPMFPYNANGYYDNVWDTYEPQFRRDALLEVTTISDAVAGTVSSMLRNLGGRKIKTIRK